MIVTLLFILGLVLLIKGADVLVTGAASIARRLDVPDIVIGLTIVSFGTSAPELFVNLYASITGSTDLAIGNVIGSNIANIWLILGIAAVIAPLKVQRNTVWKEIPLSLLAAVMVIVLAGDVIIDSAISSAISRSDGLVLMAFFSIFLYYTFELTRSTNDLPEAVPDKVYPVWKSILFIVGGLAGLTIGGKWIVDGATAMALSLGLSNEVIGLTVVAVGTSLPELATSAIAAYRGKADIAVGNVVGSNIFNVFWILGLSATITPLPFNEDVLLDVVVNIFASILLFSFLFVGKRHLLQRWQGIMFLVFYVSYITFTLAR